MVTITDVARHAGVAPSTVSHVLSGKRPVSPETRERVPAGIAVLGYRPHAGARAPAASRTHVLVRPPACPAPGSGSARAVPCRRASGHGDVT